MQWWVRRMCVVVVGWVFISAIEGSPLDDFVKSQSSTTPVRSLVYKRSIPIENSKPEEYFIHARWQKDAVYFRDLDRLADLDFFDTVPHGHFLSHFGSNYWSAEGRKLFMYSGPASDSIPMIPTVAGKEAQILKVLNLGVVGIVPGTCKWEGKQFSATGWKGETIQGSLTLDEDGSPHTLDYTSGTSERPTRRRVKYFYSNGLELGSVPFRMQLYALAGQTEKLSEVLEIYYLERSEKPLGESYFNPDLVVVRGLIPAYQRAFYTTNGVIFEPVAPSLPATSR